MDPHERDRSPRLPHSYPTLLNHLAPDFAISTSDVAVIPVLDSGVCGSSATHDVVRGGVSPFVPGGVSSPVRGGGVSPLDRRGVSPIFRGGVSPIVGGDVSPIVRGGFPPIVRGGNSPIVRGGVSPQVRGSASSIGPTLGVNDGAHTLGPVCGDSRPIPRKRKVRR